MRHRGVLGLTASAMLLMAGASWTPGAVADQVGDVQYTATWTEGPGPNQTTLTIKNTADPSGQEISEWTFTLDQSGITVVSVTGSAGCSPQGPVGMSCSAPIPPGGQVSATINTNQLVTPGSGGMFTPYDQGDVAQGPAAISGPTSAGASDLKVSLTYPKQIFEARRTWTFTVAVANIGTIYSAPTTLSAGFGPAQTASSEEYGFPTFLNPGGAPSGYVTVLHHKVPGLPPNGIDLFELKAVLVRGRLSSAGGPIPIFGVIPTDADGNDGDDSATATVQAVATAYVDGAQVCSANHARDRARSAASSCPAASVHGFSGTASGKLTSVQIAVERIGKGAHAASGSPCAEMTSAGGRFKSVPADRGVCDMLDWLTAKGTSHWSFALHGKLAPGSYVLYCRPVTAIGSPDAGFSVKSHDELPFTLR